MQDEAELIELQQILVKAWLTGDRTMVERIIAPDWTSTGPDARTTDRATVLAQVLETGMHQIRDLKIDDVKARVFGDARLECGGVAKDEAVLSGEVIVEGYESGAAGEECGGLAMSKEPGVIGGDAVLGDGSIVGSGEEILQHRELTACALIRFAQVLDVQYSCHSLYFISIL